MMTKLVLLLAAFGGEAMVIKGQDVVGNYKLVRLDVENAPNGYSILWDVYPFENVDPATQKKRSHYEFVAPPGTYKVRVRAIRNDSEDIPEAWKTVTVQGTAPPAPVPPGPTPPGPTPQPPNPPIPGEGNRVLIVYETGKQLPAGQAAIITSGVLRDYLDSKCTPAGYRVWDQNTLPTGASDQLKAAMARPRSSIPWIVISNGKDSFEGALPGDVPQTIALLKKYFGG